MVMTFTRKDIEFPSLEERIHTFEARKAVLEKVNHIRVSPHAFACTQDHILINIFRPATKNTYYVCYISIIIYNIIDIFGKIY